MKHIHHGKALLIKAIMVLPILWIILSLFNDVSLIHSTMIAIVLGLASYYLGDMAVLPKMGNTAAIIGDFLLSLLIIWVGLILLGYREALGEAFLAAAIITAGEALYHVWLIRTQFIRPEKVRRY